MTAKAENSRLFSGIGYQNETPQHAWVFQDAPLPDKAFFGGRYAQKGVQLRWPTPTTLFAEVAMELRGARALFTTPIDTSPCSKRS